MLWSRGTDFKTKHSTSVVVALTDPAYCEAMQAVGRATRSVNDNVKIGMIVPVDHSLSAVSKDNLFTKMKDAMADNFKEDGYRASLLSNCHNTDIDPKWTDSKIIEHEIALNNPDIFIYPGSSRYKSSGGGDLYKKLRKAREYGDTKLPLKQPLVFK